MKAWLVGALLGITLAAGFAEELAVLDAKQVDLLREKEGQEVIVEGDVVDVGTTANGGLTFINVGLPKKQGFVAIVKQSSYGGFPAGFDGFKGQRVRIKGLLFLYNQTQPEIEIIQPDQITVVPPPQ